MSLFPSALRQPVGGGEDDRRAKVQTKAQTMPPDDPTTQPRRLCLLPTWGAGGMGSKRKPYARKDSPCAKSPCDNEFHLPFIAGVWFLDLSGGVSRDIAAPTRPQPPRHESRRLLFLDAAMPVDDPSDAPLVVDFLLVPDFSLIAFAAAMEPLRLANRVAGHELYRWRITSLDGQAVTASGGVPVAVDHATDAGGDQRADPVQRVDVQRQIDDRLLGLLRRVSRQGAMNGAVCTGAFAPARAGLLNTRRSTIHWETPAASARPFRKSKPLPICSRSTATVSPVPAAPPPST